MASRPRSTVWKFGLPSAAARFHVVYVEMPQGARPLHVGLDRAAYGAQSEDLAVWAHVDPDAPRVPHAFSVTGTGTPVVGHPVYVGTVQTLTGLVWHVWDRGDGKAATPGGGGPALEVPAGQGS